MAIGGAFVRVLRVACRQATLKETKWAIGGAFLRVLRVARRQATLKQPFHFSEYWLILG